MAALGPLAGLKGVVASGAVGRACSIGLMLTMTPVHKEGLGASYVTLMRRGPAAVGLVATVVGCVALLGSRSLAALGLATVTTVLVGVVARRKIGGIVGDVLGAAARLGDLAVLGAAVWT